MSILQDRRASRRKLDRAGFNWIMAVACLLAGFAWGTVIFAICEVIR